MTTSTLVLPRARLMSCLVCVGPLERTGLKQMSKLFTPAFFLGMEGGGLLLLFFFL